VNLCYIAVLSVLNNDNNIKNSSSSLNIVHI